jgi:hypothetical protein
VPRARTVERGWVGPASFPPCRRRSTSSLPTRQWAGAGACSRYRSRSAKLRRPRRRRQHPRRLRRRQRRALLLHSSDTDANGNLAAIKFRSATNMRAWRRASTSSAPTYPCSTRTCRDRTQLDDATLSRRPIATTGVTFRSVRKSFRSALRASTLLTSSHSS